jgi:hypothetical protein
MLLVYNVEMIYFHLHLTSCPAKGGIALELLIFPTSPLLILPFS